MCTAVKGWGAKQPHQKYFMTKDQKIEFDKACLMSQQQPIATNFCYFDCQLVSALVTLLHSILHNITQL